MNRDNVKSITRTAERALDQLHQYGTWLFDASHDWQSPLRGGSQPGCKGEHSDPTSSTVLNPDPLAGAHHLYQQLLKEHQRSAVALAAFITAHAPLTPAQADLARNRVNSDPGCVACGGPAPAGHRRAGKCDACRKAWERAGKPDLTTFRRMRQREAEAAAARIHEHEQETA